MAQSFDRFLKLASIGGTTHDRAEAAVASFLRVDGVTEWDL